MFDKLRKEEADRHLSQMAAITWAESAVHRLHLDALLDPEICNHLGIRYREFQNGDKRNTLDIYVTADKRQKVLQIITGSAVEKWRKNKFLSTYDYGDGYREWLYTDYDYYDDDRNRITIRLAVPANEGDVVDGCEIKAVTREIKSLQLACDA